eukprot:scaffold648643_cov52-Prasinocladus_malaysianus.AAC.1
MKELSSVPKDSSCSVGLGQMPPPAPRPPTQAEAAALPPAPHRSTSLGKSLSDDIIQLALSGPEGKGKTKSE